MRKEYTLEGLPVITKETGLSLGDIIKRDIKKNNYEVAGSFIKRLNKENPFLVLNLEEFFEGILNKWGYSDVLDSYFMGTLIVYEALRKQFVSNKLKEEMYQKNRSEKINSKKEYHTIRTKDGLRKLPYYTEDRIPVITEETYISFTNIITNKTKMKEFTSDFTRKLKKSNPLLARLIIKTTSKEVGLEDADGALCISASITYELLRRQAEANKLKEQFKL